MSFLGRRRHGIERKESHTVSLAPDVVDRLAALGRDGRGKPNLSAGIAIAEHMTRGMTPPTRGPVRRVTRQMSRDWYMFELVDGPADLPPPGHNFDIRET